MFPEVAAAFVQFLWRGMTPTLANALTAEQDYMHEHLFNLFAPFALQNFSKEIESYR